VNAAPPPLSTCVDVGSRRPAPPVFSAQGRRAGSAAIEQALHRFFRSALAHHPRAARTAWLRTTSPIRVFGADLADLADLRLPAEANYLQALLHSPCSLRMTQVSASGLNYSRERTPNEEVAAGCIFDAPYSLQARRSKGTNVPTSPSWVERNIVVPTTIRYGWMPHNAGFGFLDLTQSILLLRQFWD
jgi:hypothetical protein